MSFRRTFDSSFFYFHFIDAARPTLFVEDFAKKKKRNFACLRFLIAENVFNEENKKLIQKLEEAQSLTSNSLACFAIF